MSQLSRLSRALSANSSSCSSASRLRSTVLSPAVRGVGNTIVRDVGGQFSRGQFSSPLLRFAARAVPAGVAAATLSQRQVASSAASPAASPAAAAEAGSSSVHMLSGALLDGRTLPLAALAGKPAVIVNVASE